LSSFIISVQEDEDGNFFPQLPLLEFLDEKIVMNSAYIIDTGDKIILFIGKVTHRFFCEKVH
jgi:hypothetical protein